MLNVLVNAVVILPLVALSVVWVASRFVRVPPPDQSAQLDAVRRENLRRADASYFGGHPA